jgi:hypothetical protein
MTKPKFELKQEKKTSESAQYAWFMHWASVHYPDEWQALGHIIKMVNPAIGRTPAADSDRVIKLKGAKGRIEKILVRDYGQYIQVESGLGWRATTSQAKIATNILPAAQVRANQAFDRVRGIAGGLDPNDKSIKALPDDQKDGLKTLQKRLGVLQPKADQPLLKLIPVLDDL